LAIRPSSVGTDAAAAAARRVGGLFNQTGEALTNVGARAGSAIRDAGDVAVAHMDHEQISQGAAKGTEVFDNLINSKDEVIKNLDPKDPAYGSQVEAAIKGWRETVMAPALDKFREGFTTERSQDWAEHFIDQTREHMFTHTTADIMSAAGIGVTNSIRNTANIASNTALSHPETVDDQLNLVEHSINGIVDSSPMKGVAGAKVRSDVLERTKEQIVKAGAIGAIQKSADPEATAAEWIGKYPQYINGAEATTLADNARKQIRARNSDFEANRHRDKEIAQDKSTDQTNQYLIDIRSRDPKIANDPTGVKILNDPTLTKPDKNNLLNLIDRQLKPETDARISNETMTGLMRQLRNPDADPDKLMDAAWDARIKDPGTPGSLTESHFNSIRKEIIDRKTPDGMALSQDRNQFLSDFGAAVDGGMTGNTHSALGRQQMAKVRDELLTREEELKKRGVPVRELYRPGSANYFDTGGAAAGKFSVSMQQALNYQLSIGNKGKPQGTQDNPLSLPPGTTPAQARALVQPGMWFTAPGENAPRQMK
jgi:hypothetical protein